MKRTILLLAGVLLCASLGTAANAQYPDRAIKMIVPWAAGGDTDNIFRPAAQQLHGRSPRAQSVDRVRRQRESFR